MANGNGQSAWALVLVLGASGACDGRVTPLPTGGPGGVDSTGGSTGGVSSSGAGTSSGGTTASYDAGHCVDLDVLTYDTSCEVDSDCIDVTAGRICDSYPCTCGGTAISAIGQSRYDAALASALASVG